MYSPANSASFTHDNWKSSVPRSFAPPGAVVPLVDAAGFDELPHAASKAERPPVATTASPAPPTAPRRKKLRRSSDRSPRLKSATVPPPSVPAHAGPDQRLMSAP